MATTSERFPNVGIIPSPAACPGCGSMDLSTPFHGRRTGLWLSTCRDCGRKLYSLEYFTLEPRTPRARVDFTKPVTPYEPRPNDDAMVSANEARMAVMKSLNLPPQRSREPGEEG